MTLAVEKLKETLCTSFVLVYPNYNKTFIVSIDASSRTIGAVLSQLDGNGREDPIQYASRNLNEAEKIYSASNVKRWVLYSFRRSFAYDCSARHSSCTQTIKH